MKSKLIYHKAYEGILDNEHLRQHIDNRNWDINSVPFHWKDENNNVLEDGQFCVDIYYSSLPYGFKDRKTRYEESLVQFKQGLFLERYLLVQSLIDKQSPKESLWNSWSWFKKIPSTVYFGAEWLKNQNVGLEDIRIECPHPYKTLKDFVDAMHTDKEGVRNVYVTRNLIPEHKPLSKKLQEKLMLIVDKEAPVKELTNLRKLKRYCAREGIDLSLKDERGKIIAEVDIHRVHYSIDFDGKTKEYIASNEEFTCKGL